MTVSFYDKVLIKPVFVVVVNCRFYTSTLYGWIVWFDDTTNEQNHIHVDLPVLQYMHIIIYESYHIVKELQF